MTGYAAEGVTTPYAPTRTLIGTPEDAYDVLADVLVGLEQESCYALALDTKHGVIDTVLISIGSLDHTFMEPREVYRPMLLRNAAATVVAHNHPSGNPTPSQSDRELTRRLEVAGELLGVTLLDHLVIGEGGAWVSLAREGEVGKG